MAGSASLGSGPINHRIFSFHRKFSLNKMTGWRFEPPTFGTESLGLGLGTKPRPRPDQDQTKSLCSDPMKNSKNLQIVRKIFKFIFKFKSYTNKLIIIYIPCSIEKSYFNYIRVL
jgi:hypothetical protein